MGDGVIDGIILYVVPGIAVPLFQLAIVPFSLSVSQVDFTVS